MASYVQKTLVEDERIVYMGRISLWNLLPLIVAGFALLPLAGFGLLFWLAAAVRYITTELAITNKRVIAKFGFIRRTAIELNIAKVESIQVNQCILGRILNFGTLVISGAGTPQAPIPGISSPMMFRRCFMEYQDQSLKANV